MTTMTQELQILLAVGIDLLLGDPRGWPHPVRWIGWLIGRLEALLYGVTRWERFNGVLLAMLVIGLTGAAAFFGLSLAARISPWAHLALSVIVLYWSLSIRDLYDHARQVYSALRADDLPGARAAVSLIVGRDTESLNEAGVVRAAVESVAENTVDGVLAPLFFAVLFGPAGAMMYKAASTLDSMVGYKNEKYQHFGWASARLDDAANYFPARLSAPLMAAGALMTGNRPIHALRVCLRDRKNHASPNSGIPEAAMAGALGVCLGGPLFRNGVLMALPTLGDALAPLEREHILKACRIMLVSSLLAAALFTGARWLIS